MELGSWEKVAHTGGTADPPLVSQSSSHHLTYPLPVVFLAHILLHHPLPSPVSLAVPLVPAGHAARSHTALFPSRDEGGGGPGQAAAARSVRGSRRVCAEDMGTASERRHRGGEEHRKSLKSLPPCLVARS